MVFHCHGHFGRPEDMIVSERDYREQYLGRKHEADLGFQQTIRLSLGSNSILFVGYGLSDEDLLRSFANVHSN